MRDVGSAKRRAIPAAVSVAGAEGILVIVVSTFFNTTTSPAAAFTTAVSARRRSAVSRIAGAGRVGVSRCCVVGMESPVVRADDAATAPGLIGALAGTRSAVGVTARAATLGALGVTGGVVAGLDADARALATMAAEA